ncbi:hypothetical protein AGDE_15283 [Angomonas deanei]|uniref:Uncharacterized protein n=1 Tax=Angomonas deanei TaxID=59799 RepID=A0A7G2CMA6_9TRYP|nr:hypothetical protein AGDE_15283 [Angomonas deanei]CAD2220966.1 hypothetical protein, conserved [Angomonas deanei]|eukprot:EPY19357.1 hypothetical protein AGDE_15283 [Angomonas deanei]
MPLPSFKVQLGLRIGGLLVRVLSAVAVLGAIFFQLRHARQLANSPAPTEVAAPRAAPAQQVWQCGTRPFPGFELEESPYGLTTYTERKGDQEVAAADEKTVFGQELDITEEELREAEEEQRREEGLRLPAVPSADLLSDRSYEGTSRSLCGVVLEDGGSRKLAILRLRHQKRTRIFIIVFMVVQIITFIAGVANIVLTFALDGIEFSTGGVHIQSSYSMDKSAVIGVSCAFVIFAFLVCWAIYQRKMF